MKKWSNVVFSIWLIFFSIMLSNYLLSSIIQYEFLIVMILTALIYFLLVMFETMRKK